MRTRSRSRSTVTGTSTCCPPCAMTRTSPSSSWPMRPRSTTAWASTSRSSTTCTPTSTPPGCASASGSTATTRVTPTVTALWEGAMFHEREMYDMMGIVFEGNRDLRRIYMSPDYRSFPQRKDFILPDDAADSPAAGVNPLERPETWDLTRSGTRRAHRRRSPANAADDRRRGAERARSKPTRAGRDDEDPIPDPHPGPDRAGPGRPEARLGAAVGPEPGRPPSRAEYVGFDMVGIPDRPPQTEREARGLLPRRGGDAPQHGAAAPVHPRRDAAGGEGPRRDGHRPRPWCWATCTAASRSCARTPPTPRS